MSRATKIWLVAAACLVALGLIIFAAAMSVCGWDFDKLDTEKYETSTFEISEGFSSISISADTADVLLALSDDDTCRVVCYERDGVEHSADVRDDTLVVDTVDDRKWYEYIGISFDMPSIIVYLPRTEYASLIIKGSAGAVEVPGDFGFSDIDICSSTGDVALFASASGSVAIKTSTGGIRVEGISADGLELSSTTGGITVRDVSCGDVGIDSSTGETELRDVECRSLVSVADTGDIALIGVVASEKLEVELSTGNVAFDGSDAAEIIVKTDTGDVTGSLLTDKTFVTQTETGRVDVPAAPHTGGICRISTYTGDIKIKID